MIGPSGPRQLRPSYEMVALFAMPGFRLHNRSLRDIKAVKWQSYKPSGHPAEKPEELFRWLIEISTMPGAVICDPFMGSGTAGAAAVSMGRSFIGIEQDEIWFKYADERIRRAQKGT